MSSPCRCAVRSKRSCCGHRWVISSLAGVLPQKESKQTPFACHTEVGVVSLRAPFRNIHDGGRIVRTQFKDRPVRQGKKSTSRLDQWQGAEKPAGLDNNRRYFRSRNRRADFPPSFFVACQVIPPEFISVPRKRLKGMMAIASSVTVEVTIPEPLVLMQDGTMPAKRQVESDFKSLTLFPTLI